jgi:putative membrane-bound dehydrogenase-like protein
MRIAHAMILVLATTRVGLSDEFKIDGHTFKLPEGFTIERVAGPPLVDRPIVADFDEQGRLYVADSSGSNDNVKKQLEDRTHRIVRLEDTDGDGKYDKRTVFADRMMFPEGAMWYAGSLYVAAPPSIWKLTDADGDGIAERREEWFQGKTLTGCANDLHGPYLGPDGWIYWCKGAFARQTYKLADGSTFDSRAAHIFRARPDGTGIEPVMTGGMDNPVEIVFTPGGELIFTTTFLQSPAGGRRDGLIHAVYGGVYGKVNDVLDGHKRTSPDVMPVLTHLGPAAPSGLVRYESKALGEQYVDNLYVCQFNLRKVSRHTLVARNATFLTLDKPDFLTSPDQDFHPTDVLEDADGSLLVVDTGGWYKLCCPTSQLEKPEVLGAIYRIRNVGARKVDDPRGLKLDWENPTAEALAGRLDDPRHCVRRRAVETLARRGREAIPLLQKIVRAGNQGDTKTQAIQNAIWTATRIDGDEARTVARLGLSDKNPIVRQVALHSISLWRDRAALPLLLEAVKPEIKSILPHGPRREPLVHSGPPEQHPGHNPRAAAEALGRIGDRSAVPAILNALGAMDGLMNFGPGPFDPVFTHSLIYALIEIGDPVGTVAGLTSEKPTARMGAMIALDQMKNGGLKVEQVAPDLFFATDPMVRESASWIVGRHPEWGGALAGTFRERLRSKSLDLRDNPELNQPLVRFGKISEAQELMQQLARFGKVREVQEVIGAALTDRSSTLETRTVALTAIRGSGLKTLPASWVAGLQAALADEDARLNGTAVATLRGLALQQDPGGELAAGLREVADKQGLPATVRLGALLAVPGSAGTVSPALFELIQRQLNPDRPVASRLLAADVAARGKLSADQLKALADLVATAGPLEIDRLLPAFEATTEEAVGLRLIDVLGRSPAFASLRPDMIRPRLAKYGAEVRRRGEELCAKLNVDAAKQKARIDELLSNLPSGDIRRGQAVFNGAKAACLTCHEVGYVGGKIGPDLTKVGATRSDRDLLEAIVYPSLSFVRSYEPVVVATKDGRTLSGLVRKDSSDELILNVAANQDVRVARDEIEEIRPGTVSLMPAGLDAQISRQELADLVAFLRSRK